MKKRKPLPPLSYEQAWSMLKFSLEKHNYTEALNLLNTIEPWIDEHLLHQYADDDGVIYDS